MTDERKESKKVMPSYMMIIILIFIICYIFIARTVENPLHKDNSITVSSIGMSANEGVEKESQKEMKKQITTVLMMFGMQYGNTEHETGYNILLNEIKNDVIDLSGESLQRVNNSMIDMQKIIDQEKTNKFINMSLEGRKRIIHIIKEIFKIYGYHIVVNLNGDIENISDYSGVLVYSKSQFGISGTQYKVFVLILLLVFLALIICILIANKNQLFKKDVRYDGINKKRYA